jgi:hypothetical protein
MFVQRGAARTTAPALCTNRVGAKHARSGNDETISDDKTSTEDTQS